MIDLASEQLAIVRRLLATHVPECEVRAFGSRVVWTAKAHSDLDLAVVGQGKIATSKLRRLREAFEESGLSIRVDLIDWNAISPGFQKVIEPRYKVLQKAAKVSASRDEWEVLPLGELTENFDGRRVPVKELERKPGPYPYYGASGIVDHVDGYLFDGEYLLIGEDGENLRTRQTPIAFMARGKFWVNNHAHIVRGNHRADTHFLNYVLSQTDISGYLTGSTMPKLTQGNLNRLPVIAPPLAEQKAIAAVLGALDDKIELNRRMNATLEAMARALFQSWFVDFDPVRAKLDGCPPAALFPNTFQDSPLGHIPHGWEVKTLGEVIELAYGKPLKAEDRKNGPVCVYGANGPVGWHDEKLVSGPGIVVGRKGNPGVVTWAHGDFYPIDTTFYVEPKGDCRSLYFLYYALSLHNLANLSADSAVPGLNRNHAYMSKQVIPSQPVLTAFDSQISPIFTAIHANDEQSRTLATLRDTLLPKLLSGELTVAEAEKVNHA